MARPRKNSNRPLTPVEKLDLSVARRSSLDPDGVPGKAISRFAEIGDQPPLSLLSAAVVAAGALRRDERLARTGLRMLAALSLSTMAKTLGKGTIDRTRPEEMIENGNYRLEEGDSRDAELRSMPSGHSAGVTAVALAAVQDYPGRLMPAAAVAGAVMAAQLPSRNHFLSDIVAGAALGLVAGGLASLLVPAQARLRGPDRREPARSDRRLRPRRPPLRSARP